jgi:hypothetical protein
MNEPAWLLDRTDRDLLALCEHLEARPSSQVPEFVDDFVPPSGDADVQRLVSVAADRGLLTREPGWADGGHADYPVLIASGGRRWLADVRQGRTSRPGRIAATRQALLVWAYDHALDNPGLPMNSPRRFASDPSYNFWGTPFAEGHVLEATNYLVESGLLELYGAPMASGEPQNVQITADGKNCVERQAGDVNTYLERRDSGSRTTVNNSQTFAGDFYGQNAQGHTNTQTYSSGIDADAFAAIFTSLRSVLPQIHDPDDRAVLTLAVDDLERVASQDAPDLGEVNKRVGLLRRLVARAGNAALTTTTNTATGGLLELLENAFS